jgi:Heterokaryon incompatibility protein (HET)
MAKYLSGRHCDKARQDQKKIDSTLREYLPAPDAALDEHFLCDLCRDMVNSFDVLARNRVSHDYPERSHPHYATFGLLRKSAWSGCHICSLFVPYAHSWSTDYNHTTQDCQTYILDTAMPRHYRATADENVGTVAVYMGDARIPTRCLQVRMFLVSSGWYRDTLDDIMPTSLGYRSTASEATFGLARTWLETCLAEHQTCPKFSNSSRFIPDRLLEIKIENGRIVTRICLVETLPCYTPYFTLSYCWGDANPLRLTRANHDSFCMSIELDELPKTFLDAAIVVLKLGYNYLWIDSLCIIQDSIDDWEEQAAAMQNIYNSGVCNLAAMDSRNCEAGLFAARNPLALRDYVMRGRPGQILKFYETDSGRVGLDRERQHTPPLSTRGWAVQELALSPRTIYYCSELICWECHECVASEKDPVMRRSMGRGSGHVKVTL